MGSLGGRLFAQGWLIPLGAGTHVMPWLKGETALIHAVCHRMIHKTLSKGELARDYATVEALRAHEGLRRFWEWVGSGRRGGGGGCGEGGVPSRARSAHDLGSDICLGVNASNLVDEADFL